MIYNFPEHKRGDTFGGVQFTLSVNGAAKNLSGAVINMKIGNNVLSTTTGEFVITDAVNGGFQFKEQIITLSARNYYYEITFVFSTGVVKTYIKGTWNIIR